jgi:hypothetical protein
MDFDINTRAADEERIFKDYVRKLRDNSDRGKDKGGRRLWPVLAVLSRMFAEQRLFLALMSSSTRTAGYCQSIHLDHLSFGCSASTSTE